MAKINPEELLKHGLHFGHKSQRVNPRSRKYIYKIENGISIIDLFKTAEELEKALNFVKKLGEEGKTLLVVATKKQAKSIVSEIARANDVYFLTNKWIGGFLTNIEEMKKNIKKMVTMKQDKEDGTWDKFPKHERFKMDKQLMRILKSYEGVASMDTLPDALFIIDIKTEANAVKEAFGKNIPVVGVSDTNSDPFKVTYPIPANDDALSSIEYLAKLVIETYANAKKEPKKDVKEPKVEKEVKKEE